MKSLTADNYFVRPFLTHKGQSFTFTVLSGSNPSQVSVDIAIKPTLAPGFQFDSASAASNPSGIYMQGLYAATQNLMYRSGSVYSRGYRFVPVENVFYVVSVAQAAYGEKIRPASILLTSATSTSSLVDDGVGNIVSAAHTSSVVGSVNYELGLIVLKQVTGSFSSSVITDIGSYFTTGSKITIDFEATQTIYEHQIICTMEPGEFNYSMNPSVKSASGSVAGYPSGRVMDQFASQSLTPYFTTVGFYTDLGELVVIAKVPRAIKRAVDSQQTVIARFDI
jgi:hypothetical protein